MGKKKLYWLYAETDEEKAIREAEEKKEKDLLDKLTQQVNTNLAEKFKGYDDKITAYEEEIKKLKEGKKDDNTDIDKKDNKDVIKTDPKIQEVLDKIEAQNNLFVSSKIEELKKKYSLTDEEIKGVKTLEDISSFEAIYSGAFSKAKNIYLSEEKIAEELKKKKKMITDLDDKLGEETIKKNKEELIKSLKELASKKF